MEVHIDYDRITDCFTRAREEGRDFLFEYETYELLRNSGAETPPMVNLLVKGVRPTDAELTAMPGEKVVMKIVSPYIIHKTEVSGVRIVENSPGKIRSAWRRMNDEVPENYAAWIARHRDQAPPEYRHLEGEALINAVSRDIKGVLLCQFMPPDSDAFGNELIVSLRRTREFGMIITAGLGGTDTELYAGRFKKGQAVVSAATALTNGEEFFQLFKKTIAYEKLAGLSRGQKRIVSNDQLVECFSSFIAMGNHYSPGSENVPYVIEELEVNPFAFTDYQMIPLDGLCRFSSPEKLSTGRPIHKIDRLLHPESIAIIGVSEKRVNFGRIILKNVMARGFDPAKITIVRPGTETIDGVACVDALTDLPAKTDLFIVAVGAEQVPDLVETLIDKDLAETVLLIPGGLGEKIGSEERAEKLKAKIDQSHREEGGGPVFLGGNSMGLISHPGNFDTIFIPEEKLPKQKGEHPVKSAFISQSGAFMITRTSKLPGLDPAYMLSIGNQTDLTSGDLAAFMTDLPEIDIIAVYMEGFNDMDGLAFCRAVRKAVLSGKEVIFYKAGRTPEGKSATSGHTASLAGDYAVCESCVQQAGAMVANNFTQFEDLYLMATQFHGKKIRGKRLAAVSGAGFEAVGMADNIQGEDFAMQMAKFQPETVEKIEALIREHRLSGLVDVKNPMDINPAANDLLHASIAECLSEDPDVDGIVIGLDPLSPAMQTLPVGVRNNESLDSEKSIATLMAGLMERVEKPVIGVVDGGRLYDPLVESLEKGGLPVFRSSDRAVHAVAKYIEGRLYADLLRSRG